MSATSDSETTDKKSETITTATDISLTRIKTGDVLKSLQTTFDLGASGKDYNKEQVKNMTNISNAMVKVLRFEFDVYKYFIDKVDAR